MPEILRRSMGVCMIEEPVGINAEEVDAITHRNAERLFRWQVADASLATVT